MRALRFDRFGPPTVLQLVELPAPSPSADEAVVAVRAAAINPSDVKNVAGGMSQTRPPRTPGRDFAGVVTAGPAEWQGAAVWTTGGEFGYTRDGGHAESVLVPVRALARKPARLSFAQAAAVGTPFLTAFTALERAALASGDVVLIVGAAGSVGGAAVQLARWRGARVIGLVQSEAQAATARNFGADSVVVNDGAGAIDALHAAAGEEGVEVAFDTTGTSLDACVQVLRRRGRVVVISAPPDGNVTFNARKLYRREGHIIGVDSLKVNAVAAAAILDRLAPGFESGALVAPRLTERPLDDAVAAYQERAGKIVLVPEASNEA